MASLSGKKSTGGTNWDFYVVKSQKLELQLERPAPLYLEQNSQLIPSNIILPEKTQIRIADVNLYQYGSSKFALCDTGLHLGYIPIAKIKKPSKAGVIGTLIDESNALIMLDTLIKENEYPIEIEVLDAFGNIAHSLKRCVGVRKIEGTPKADFALFSESGEEIYISHKAHGGARAFQQYSGVSIASGINIANHEEVQSFLSNVTKYVKPEGLSAPCMSAVKDPNLIGCCVFGSQFGQDFGVNNVHIVAQGNPILKPSGMMRFTLSWSDSYVINGDIASLSGDYSPVLGATFRSGRSFQFEGTRYCGARVAVYPIAVMRDRRGLVTFNEETR